jgi:DNA invertase Pin-like site-specific DNA recombinase
MAKKAQRSLRGCEGGIYSRISGQDDERTASLDTQVAACLKMAEEDGVRISPDLIFRERHTGYESLEERGDLIRLREAVAAGKIQVFYCYDTDRLARDPAALLQVVTESEKRGCQVKFKNVEHDNSPGGRLLLYVRGFASEWEFLQIRERTMRGREDILSKGQVVQNAPCRYGYIRLTEERRRIENPETAPIVREIFRLAADEGLGVAQIANLLNARGVKCPGDYRGHRRKSGLPSRWGSTTVSDIIRDETYLGIVTAQRSKKLDKNTRIYLPKEEWRVLSDGRTEALVDQDLFDRANAALNHNPKSLQIARTRNRGQFFLLRGILFCGQCGSLMSPVLTPSRRGSRIYTFRCGARYRQSASRIDCRGASVYPHKVDDAIWSRVVEILRDRSLIDMEVERIKASRPGESLFRENLATVATQLQTLERRIQNWRMAAGDVDDPEEQANFLDLIRLAKSEQKSLQEQRGRLEAKLAIYDDMDRRADQIRERAEKVRANLDRPEPFSPQEKRDVLEWLDIKVYGNGLELEIRIGVEPDEAALQPRQPLVVQDGHGIRTDENDQHFTLAFDVGATQPRPSLSAG